MYSGIVQQGNKSGRTINFPTVNLSPDLLPKQTERGVYRCNVYYENVRYLGALYYGPRLVKKETFTVLEIFILDFDKEIYGKAIQFELGAFIRGVMNFSTFEEMKHQLKKDIEMVRWILV